MPPRGHKNRDLFCSAGRAHWGHLREKKGLSATTIGMLKVSLPQVTGGGRVAIHMHKHTLHISIHVQIKERIFFKGRDTLKDLFFLNQVLLGIATRLWVTPFFRDLRCCFLACSTVSIQTTILHSM